MSLFNISPYGFGSGNAYHEPYTQSIVGNVPDFIPGNLSVNDVQTMNTGFWLTNPEEDVDKPIGLPREINECFVISSVLFLQDFAPFRNQLADKDAVAKLPDKDSFVKLQEVYESLESKTRVEETFEGFKDNLMKKADQVFNWTTQQDA